MKLRPRLKLVAAALPHCAPGARAAGWRWPLTGPLPENYYARLELLGPKRFSEGRLGRPPPLLLDDYDEPPLYLAGDHHHALSQTSRYRYLASRYRYLASSTVVLLQENTSCADFL